jgi:phospholipid N-methyltransferase
LLFARNFFKHPMMLGSPIPSPQALVDALLSRVKWEEARVIVEYGPGVGNITGEILRRMQPEAMLVVIEMNSEFIEYLRESLDDTRLRVIHGSAAEVGKVLERVGCRQADCVISGIPFSTMPKETREEIIRATHLALQPEGAFLVYQYSRQVFPSLKGIFGRVRQEFRLFNILPTWLFHCVR